MFAEAGVDFDIFYANSNIHPESEYQHRLATIREYVETESVAVIEGAYEPERWEKTAGKIGAAITELQQKAGLEQEIIDQPNPFPLPDKAPGTAEIEAARAELVRLRKSRCRACYRLRLEETAAYAAAHGYDCISTTLSVSPYQYTDVIEEELVRAAKGAGISADFRDFRPYFPENERRSKELGMYRQNFCGCRISDEEAQLERAVRKAARKARKQAAKTAKAIKEKEN